MRPNGLPRAQVSGERFSRSPGEQGRQRAPPPRCVGFNPLPPRLNSRRTHRAQVAISSRLSTASTSKVAPLEAWRASVISTEWPRSERLYQVFLGGSDAIKAGQHQPACWLDLARQHGLLQHQRELASAQPLLFAACVLKGACPLTKALDIRAARSFSARKSRAR